jgi:hypothetical protein
MVHEVVGIDIMLSHQASECGAVLDIESLLHPPRITWRKAQLTLDERGHALVDLGEEVAASRIEGVVEVEDPRADLIEAGLKALRGVYILCLASR